MANLFQRGEGVVSSDYKTAGSNQVERFVYHKQGTGTNFETMYTVPKDKTFYVSTIIATAHTNGGYNNLGEGGAVTISLQTIANTNAIVNMPVPIKFSGGTVIQHNGETSDSHMTLIGWEE